VNVFRHFDIAQWKKSAKEGDVSTCMVCNRFLYTSFYSSWLLSFICRLPCFRQM